MIEGATTMDYRDELELKVADYAAGQISYEAFHNWFYLDASWPQFPDTSLINTVALIDCAIRQTRPDSQHDERLRQLLQSWLDYVQRQSPTVPDWVQNFNNERTEARYHRIRMTTRRPDPS
jgi:hypothetical protein